MRTAANNAQQDRIPWAADGKPIGDYLKRYGLEADFQGWLTKNGDRVAYKMFDEARKEFIVMWINPEARKQVLNPVTRAARVTAEKGETTASFTLTCNGNTEQETVAGKYLAQDGFREWAATYIEGQIDRREQHGYEFSDEPDNEGYARLGTIAMNYDEMTIGYNFSITVPGTVSFSYATNAEFGASDVSWAIEHALETAIANNLPDSEISMDAKISAQKTVDGWLAQAEKMLAKTQGVSATAALKITKPGERYPEDGIEKAIAGLKWEDYPADGKLPYTEGYAVNMIRKEFNLPRPTKWALNGTIQTTDKEGQHALYGIKVPFKNADLILYIADTGTEAFVAAKEERYKGKESEPATTAARKLEVGDMVRFTYPGHTFEGKVGEITDTDKKRGPNGVVTVYEVKGEGIDPEDADSWATADELTKVTAQKATAAAGDYEFYYIHTNKEHDPESRSWGERVVDYGYTIWSHSDEFGNYPGPKVDGFKTYEAAERAAKKKAPKAISHEEEMKRDKARRDAIPDDPPEPMPYGTTDLDEVFGDSDPAKVMAMKATATIRKEADGYHVRSKDGKNLGGPYKTEEEAKKRLAQVEYFKSKAAKYTDDTKWYDLTWDEAWDFIINRDPLQIVNKDWWHDQIAAKVKEAVAAGKKLRPEVLADYGITATAAAVKEPWEMNFKEWMTQPLDKMLMDIRMTHADGKADYHNIMIDKWLEKHKGNSHSKQARDDYFNEVNAELSNRTHRAIVQWALKNGKLVPPEVLAEYPDLAKPTATAKSGPKPPMTDETYAVYGDSEFYRTGDHFYFSDEGKVVELTEAQADEVRGALAENTKLLKTEEDKILSVRNLVKDLGLIKEKRLEMKRMATKAALQTSHGDKVDSITRKTLALCNAVKHLYTGIPATEVYPLADRIGVKARQVYNETHTDTWVTAALEPMGRTKTAVRARIEELRRDLRALDLPLGMARVMANKLGDSLHELSKTIESL